MEYTINILKSSEMTSKEIDDFILVQRDVFPRASMSYEDFKLKFLDNIFGDSLIVIAYSGETLAGARAFWRNDIDQKTAYQPSDTAVRKDFRRQGLFVKMTLPVLDMLSNNEVIYNFPNENSYPQYLKLGWKDYKIKYTRIFTPWAYQKEEPHIIPAKYFLWWIKPHLNDLYAYVKILGKYYLVRRLTDNGRYIVFGQLEKNCTAELKQVHAGLLVYESGNCPIYNRSKKIACKIVYRGNDTPSYIPSWKTDVL